MASNEDKNKIQNGNIFLLNRFQEYLLKMLSISVLHNSVDNAKHPSEIIGIVF